MSDGPGLEVGDVLDGKYEIIGVLGAGAMGVVYSAHHRKLNRNVAIKALRRDFSEDSEALARFEREALAAGSLRHKNIAEIFDAGTTADGLHYLVLELLEGRNLFQKIQSSGRITIESAIQLVAQLLEGLAAAHARGIVHRDLKPENIVVVKDDNGDPLVKVLDFGISKIIESEGGPAGPRATQLGTTVGTPRYMSREQIRGSKKLDHRTDLWSTGVLLYELVCGVGPFPQPEVLAVMAAVLEHRFDRPDVHRKDLSPQLLAVIDKAMKSNPNDRFADAKAMRDALLALPEAKGKRRLSMPHTLGAPIAGAESPPTAATEADLIAPAPQAAPPTSPPPTDGPKYETGLSAAAGTGVSQNEQAMLAALDRMGVSAPAAPTATPPPSAATRHLEAQLEFGSAPAKPDVPSLELGPVVDSPPAKPEVPSLELGPVVDSPPAKKRPPQPVLAPPRVQDAFAPPQEASPVPLTVERVRRGTVRPARVTAAGSQVRASESAGGTMAPRPKFRITSVLVPVLLVGLLAAGGGLLYRYYKLGYWFTAPTSDVVNVRFAVVPSEAEITVNGTMVTSFPFVGTAGETYKIVYSAPGRVSAAEQITPAIGATPGLRMRLHHQLPRLGSEPETTKQPTIDALPTATVLDSAMSKIERFRRCFDATANAVSEAQRAYNASTRSGVQSKSLPVIATLPKADVGACRAAVGVALNKDPALAALDPAAAAYVASIEQVGQLLTNLERYYKTGDYKADKLKMGKARHRDLKTRLSAAVAKAAEMKVALSASERLWSWKELALIEAKEGLTDHAKLRRLLLTARAYAAATAQKETKTRRRELLAMLQKLLKQTEESATTPDGSTDGATSMLNLLAPLAKASPDDPVRHYNQAVEHFNGLVVGKRAGLAAAQ